MQTLRHKWFNSFLEITVRRLENKAFGLIARRWLAMLVGHLGNLRMRQERNSVSEGGGRERKGRNCLSAHRWLPFPQDGGMFEGKRRTVGVISHKHRLSHSYGGSRWGKHWNGGPCVTLGKSFTLSFCSFGQPRRNFFILWRAIQIFDVK